MACTCSPESNDEESAAVRASTDWEATELAQRDEDTIEAERREEEWA